MVWLTTGESLINVVIYDKPKVLTGLTKRYVVGPEARSSSGADSNTTGGEAEHNPCMVHM